MTASSPATRRPIRQGSIRLHEKVAQQLPLRRKACRLNMEGYARLCINACAGNALISAESDGSGGLLQCELGSRVVGGRCTVGPLWADGAQDPRG
jgi:hypothetical protein